MPKIIPIRDLENPNGISELCHTWDEPVFITKDGYGDMVVMSMELYEANMRRLEIQSKIEEAEADIREGRVMSAEDSMRNVRRKYGL